MDRMGWTRSRAYLYATGQRTPKLELALEIYRKTGAKAGPLANATDAEIKRLRGTVAQIEERAA